MNILDKLKIKPVPQKQEQFNIKIGQPIVSSPPEQSQPPKEVDDIEKPAIKTKIIDKTKDKLVDRAQFLSKINPLADLTSLSKMSADLSTQMLSREDMLEKEMTIPAIPQKPVKIRKLKEKIKLGDKDVEQIHADDIQPSEQIKNTQRPPFQLQTFPARARL